MFLRSVFALLALPCLVTAADPTKLAVRYTPMEESPRSIYVPLRNDLHLAFDTALLRIHTAWAGDGLKVNGTPHTASKTPFVSELLGTPFHTTPPLLGWSVGPHPEYYQDELPTGARFLGVDTRNNETTFSFQLPTGSGNAVSITQTVHPLPGVSHGFGNVLRIGPGEETIWYSFYFEHGSPPTYVFQPDAKIGAQPVPNGNRWFAADSTAPVSFIGIAANGGYTRRKYIHNDGDTESAVEAMPEPLKHLFLKIPPHQEPVTVYFLTMLQPGTSLAPADVQRIEQKLAAFKQSVSANAPDPVAVERHTAGGMKIRPPRGDDFYQIESFPLPPAVQLQVTGMDWLTNGDLAVCTWPGEIWIVEHPAGTVGDVSYRLFAEGLNEPLGLAVVNGEIIVAQKPELTRVRDTNGDGTADTFECITDDWGYTGNYHSFAFGPAVDRDGSFYVSFCGQRATQDVNYAGWMIKVSPDGGSVEGFANGLRAPNGFGFYGPDNDLFVTDNQGNWVGACKLNHVQRGHFYGFPAATPAPPELWTAPADDFTPPAVWFPRAFAPSASGFVTIPEDGFGPFGGQMLIADFQNAVVLRVQLEKVNGDWQGAVFPFTKGFESGANRMAFDQAGHLYVGGVKNKAWAAAAPFEQSLERVGWNGRTPFAVAEVHATRDGFELVFTKPQAGEFAEDPESYFVSQFNYEHHQTYGSAEFDHNGTAGSATEIAVESATLSADGKTVRLKLDGLKTGYVTRFLIPDLESTDGDLLWHDEFFYTLNAIPAE